MYINDMIYRSFVIRALDIMLVIYCGCVIYADDLIPVLASVNLLQRMIYTYCEEAVYLDMKFNTLKSNIIRWTEMY